MSLNEGNTAVTLLQIIQRDEKAFTFLAPSYYFFTGFKLNILTTTIQPLNTVELHLSGRWLSGSAWSFW